MAAIPTLAEEDAKRPNRERERLVRERTRIVNRMKSCLVRFGVRNFKPTLRKAPERLATLGTPEGFLFRQTHFSNFAETWHDCALSWTRSRRLRRRVRSG
jgi:transposase